MSPPGTNTRPESSRTSPSPYPDFRSHFLPRTRPGRRSVLAFLALFALAEPPVLYVFANRVEPWIFGVPFLYAYLLIIYCALIAVLLWAHRRGV